MKHYGWICLLAFPFILMVESRIQAINYFIHNKKVKNFTINTIDNYKNSSTTFWIEYNYYFHENEVKSPNYTETCLKVGVFLQESTKFDCRISKTYQITGFSIDVIKWLQTKFKFNLKFLILNNTSELEKSLLSQEIDIAICHPSFPSTTNMDVSALHPTLKSKHLLIYKPRKLNFTEDIFILTFAGSLWLVFLILLIILAVFLRISTTKYAMLHPKYEAWSWVEITLWAIAAACQQGLSHTPSGFASCCIFFLGYLTAYLLYTGFAAAITSLLLQHDNHYSLDLLSLNAEKFTLICFDDSKFMTRSLQEQFKRTIYVEKLENVFDYLNQAYTIGLVPEILINQQVAAKFLTTKLAHLAYQKSFFMLRNNTYKKSFNSVLFRLVENGVLQNMLKRNKRNKPRINVIPGYSSAGREHVGSAMLILLGGILFSVIFLFSECIFGWYKRNRKIIGL